MVARVPSKSYRQGGSWVAPVKRWYAKDGGWVPTPPAPTYYVATTGSDGNPGTEAQPWGTVNYAVQQLTAGDVLMVRGGTYTERIQSPTINVGSYYDRITMRAYPGETPIIQGLFWMTTPSYWVFDGINVTWDDATGSAGEHMVKMTNGTRWIYRNAEVWGAKSFAAFLIAGDASYWRVTGCYMHDTYLSNGTNQDHLLYTNSTGLGGMIDHNLLHTSPNGRAIKVGPPSQGTGDTNELEIAYNSMYDNLGPSNVQLAWEVYNTVIHHNIMDKPAPNRSAVTAFQLLGTGNIVRDNVYWQSPRVVDADPGVTDGGGNFLADPQWSNLTPTPTADMAATNPAVVGYGHTTPVDDAAVQVSNLSVSAVVTSAAARVSSLSVTAVPLLDTAVWVVDAADIVNGNTLTDRSGNGRNLVLGSVPANPTVLYHDGTDYLHIPATSQGVQITTTAALAFTATRKDATTFTGTTPNGAWLFDEPGDWTDIRTDDGSYIVDFASPAADYLTLGNSGSAGGSWSVVRAATGLKASVVDRPIILFGGAQEAFTASVPQSSEQTIIAAWRLFGSGDQQWTFLDTAVASNAAGRTLIYRGSSGTSTGMSVGATQSDGSTIVTDGYSVGATWDGEHVLAGRFDQGTLEAFFDADTLNTPEQHSSAPALFGADGIRVGGTYNGETHGEFLAAAVFDRALSDEDIAYSGAELLAQWQSIPPATPPVDPPLWAQDFESFTVDTAITAGAQFDSVAGNVMVRSVDGSQVMSVEPTGAEPTLAANVVKNLSLTDALFVTFDLKMAAWGTGTGSQWIVWSETSGDLPRLYLDRVNQGVYARVASTAETALIPISLNTWYTVEFSHGSGTTSLSVTPRAGGATVTETAIDSTQYSLTRLRFGHRYGNLSDRFYIDNIEVRE